MIQHTRLNRAIRAAVLLATGAAAVPSIAAEGVLEEVVVTAQKREQNLSEVPQAIQAFTGDMLVRDGIESIGDIAAYIPGASFVNAPAAGWQTMQIRGISSGTTGEATTGYYIDELAFGVPNLQLAPPARFFDVERVEVLRGPQGTLYGQGSMGGTVKIITADADPNDYGFKVQTSAYQGSDVDPSYNADIAVNIPLIRDKLGLRISGGFEDVAGYGESPDFPGQDDLGGSDSSNVRAKLNFTPTDSLEMALTLWHMESDTEYGSFLDAEDARYGGLDESLVAQLTPLAALADVLAGGGSYYADSFAAYAQARRDSRNQLDVDMDMASLLVEWDLGFATLVSGTSALDHQLPWNLAYAGGLADTPSRYDTSAFNQELRLVSNSGGNLKWIAGVFYSDASIDTDTVTTVPDLGPILGPATGLTGDIPARGKIQTEAWSMFGEASLLMLDGLLEPTIGVRYYSDDREAENRINGDVFDRDTSATSPRFGLKINVSEEGMVYVNAAKGFRTGAVQGQDQVNAAAALGVSTDVLLGEDSLWSYELGTKWSLLDGSLVLDGAVYYTEWDEVQTQFGTASGIAIVNGGDAEIAGIDLGFLYVTCLDGLTLQGTANFNQSEWTDTDPAVTASLPTVAEGETLPNAPERSLSLSADYRHDVGNGWDFYLHGSYAYLSEQTEITTGNETDDMNNVSLRAGVASDHWDVGVFGENLRDEDTPIALTNYTEAPQQRLYPRVFGISARYQY
jgi:outer membrane receptor protein involved in Fe transport